MGEPLLYFGLHDPAAEPPGQVLRGARVGPRPLEILTPGLAQRILILALILGSEAMIASVLFDGVDLALKQGPLTELVRKWAPWVVRAVIGFAAIFTMFAYLGHQPALERLSEQVNRTRYNVTLLSGHVLSIFVFGVLSFALYRGDGFGFPSDAIAATWIICGLATVLFLALSLLPWALWARLIQTTGKLWVYASIAAILACYVGALSLTLWKPATKLTFGLVQLFLSFFLSDMVVDPTRMRIGTSRFRAIISAECSGLEGVGLLVICGVLWLWLFRKEIRFPHALVLLPAGVVVLYILNAMRITALILIGHAGARDVAAGGFHSQAGWIAFCSVAFALSVAARRMPWVSLSTPEHFGERAQADRGAAAYLTPFLAILAAGMLSHAASGNFEWVYSLRFFAALGALWVFRKEYGTVDWNCGWLSLWGGLFVFVIWIGLDELMSASHTMNGMPAPLANAPSTLRLTWIALRVLTAVFIVPIAEELAFRGFLMRRFISEDFEAVSLVNLRWVALLISSILFGLMHGGHWLAATLAGVCYGLLAVRTGRLGDAIVAHGITNALLAGYVLGLNKWYLW